MRLFTRQPWILGLLLLMYISQSVASVSVPCHLLEQEGDEIAGFEAEPVNDHQHHIHEMDHSTHGGADLIALDVTSDSDREQDLHAHTDMLPQEDVANTALHDCCDAMNHCMSGNCSISSLDESVLHATLNAGSDARAFDVDEIPSRLAYSLYRPPILL